MSKECFNNSVTTWVSIEYNLILLKFMHCFSCHEKAVTSASAVQLLHFGEQLQNCQLMAVSYSIHGGIKPAVPSLIRNFVSSRTTSRDTVSIKKVLL